MTKNLTFHALGMIPMYLEITAAQLHESLEQLKHLEACKNKPYILDDEIVDRIIKLYSEKSELVAAGLQQCKFWRDQNPTSIQLADIEKIDANLRPQTIKGGSQDTWHVSRFKSSKSYLPRILT